MGPEKQDANLVGLYKTREASVGVLADKPVWSTREPNSFDNFGAEYSKVARRPFSPSRQRKKGSVVDMDATAGLNEDLTQNNLHEAFEDFLYAKIRSGVSASKTLTFTSKTFTAVAAGTLTITGGHGLQTGAGPLFVSTAGTLPAGLVANTPYWAIVTGNNTLKLASSYANAQSATAVTLTDTGTGAHTIDAAPAVSGNSYLVSEVPGAVKVGSILFARDYDAAANNGVKTVTSVANGSITVSGTLENEDETLGSLVLVMHPFSQGDVTLSVVNGMLVLESTSEDLTTLNLTPGSWVHLGGDEPASYLTGANNVVLRGYARIAVDGVTESTITFDKTTFQVGASTNHASVSLSLYLPECLRNEDEPEKIVRFTSTFERTLGRDSDGLQSQHVKGCTANEMTFTSPLAGLVNVDFGYTGTASKTRKGSEGPLHKLPDSKVLKPSNEDAFNTSSNLFRVRMAPVDPQTMNPMPLFAKVSEWSLSINNNATASKAQGQLGAFDSTVGNFDLDGEFTAYFSTVEAIHAIQCNHDVTFDAIYAKQGAGFFIDIPLISLGGGMLELEMDQPIMLPLEAAAAESPFGHTAMVGWFNYLPSAAMPDVDC